MQLSSTHRPHAEKASKIYRFPDVVLEKTASLLFAPFLNLSLINFPSENIPGLGYSRRQRTRRL